MSNVEKFLELGVSGWATLVIAVFALFFIIVEIAQGWDVLKGRFGFWESKTSRRIRKLEERLSQAENNMGNLNKKIDNTRSESDRKIEGVRTEFDDREHKHWGESKEIKRDYDTRLTVVDLKLDRIIEQLDKRESLDFKKLRNQIVQLGEDAIDKGKITIRKLKSLEELYSEYTDKYDGNSYVETLMLKVRELPVIGQLNEHGEDIE